MKVYLATAGEYSDYQVVRVFARQEDAANYELADEWEEYEVDEGPVEVRTWHVLDWVPGLPDREQTNAHGANPHMWSDRRDFDGHPRRVEHRWLVGRPIGDQLIVGGWDLDGVRKVYSEQRAQWIARKDTTG